MSTASTIEWTETTWNPTTGCDRISPGCDNCYALTLAKRLKAMGSAKYQNDGDPRTSGPGFGVTVHQDAITEPLRWRTPRKVFVNSMSDVAHARIGRLAQARIWAVMALTGRHQFQILTKRPKRLTTLLADPTFVRDVGQQATDIISRTPAHLGSWRLDLGGLRASGDSGIGGGWSTVTTRHADGGISDTLWLPPWPLPNIWVGTSIESDEYSWRADEIRRAPAAVRFLSLEPLLGPLPSLDLTDIHWVIAGGESGPRHRGLDLAWVRDIRDRCFDQRIRFFFKQVGGVSPKAGGRILDGRTWDEYPDAERPTEPVSAGIQAVPGMTGARKVVVCGSLAHPDLITAAVAGEQAAGRTVIAWPLLDESVPEAEHAAAWRRHIERCDEVVIVPKPDGTVGEAVAAEQSYAGQLGRTVRTWRSPRRIQLRRTKGWHKPNGAVVVGRPSRWGNPFRVGQPYQFFARGHLEMGDVRDRAHAVDLFRAWLAGRPDGMADVRVELAGRDLACWCPLDQPCHADVLLQIANEQVEAAA